MIGNASQGGAEERHLPSDWAVSDTKRARLAKALADDATALETWNALKGLPKRLKEILVMREVDGLPMAEVAARLGLSRRAADQRWAQAIVLLCGRLASPSR